MAPLSRPVAGPADEVEDSNAEPVGRLFSGSNRQLWHHSQWGSTFALHWGHTGWPLTSAPFAAGRSSSTGRGHAPGSGPAVLIGPGPAGDSLSTDFGPCG